jgi:TolA-binding protein
MDDPFALLEEKVRKAAELVRQLRRQNQDLQQEQGRIRTRLQEAEQSVQSLEKGRQAGAEEVKKAESLGREVKALRAEREEVRQRIARLLEVLAGVE